MLPTKTLSSRIGLFCLPVLILSGCASVPDATQYDDPVDYVNHYYERDRVPPRGQISVIALDNRLLSCYGA
ncbi:MAG TPA: hypothetical protein DCL09_02455 [Sutterella sp.]|nr:hypothetical protein [Sutterella sp.]